MLFKLLKFDGKPSMLSLNKKTLNSHPHHLLKELWNVLPDTIDKKINFIH